MTRREWVDGHAVLVVDSNSEILEEIDGVAAHELEPRVLALQRKFGSDVRVLVDGRHVQVAVRRSETNAPTRKSPHANDVDEDLPAQAGMQMAHSMMWQTFERVSEVQQRLLDQAAEFTRQLLEGNRRLAEQATDLQQRYQQKLGQIDYAAQEIKLIEQEAAARRLSRHIVEKSAAETAASRPGRASEVLDDLIDGATAVLESWMRVRAGEDPKGWRS